MQRCGILQEKDHVAPGRGSEVQRRMSLQERRVVLVSEGMC